MGQAIEQVGQCQEVFATPSALGVAGIDKYTTTLFDISGKHARSRVQWVRKKMTLQPPIRATLDEFGAAHPTTADQLLPLLHYVQAVHGCIPTQAMPEIALLLNVSRADVFGVVTFYDDFDVKPQRLEVAVCGAEACQALGCRSLIAEARRELEPRVRVKEVFCLGNCASGPSARIDEHVLGRVTLSGIKAALDAAEDQL